MTTFNDLIADLARENLLDEVNIFLPEKENKGSDSTTEPELPGIPLPDLLLISETYELTLPDFNVLTPEKDAHFEENQVKNVFPAQETSMSFQNTQNLIKFQARRQRTKQNPKGNKLCPCCERNVSLFRIHCHFCDTRVIGDLFYYSLIMLGFAAFTMIVWLIVASKTYN